MSSALDAAVSYRVLGVTRAGITGPDPPPSGPSLLYEWWEVGGTGWQRADACAPRASRALPTPHYGGVVSAPFWSWGFVPSPPQFCRDRYWVCWL